MIFFRRTLPVIVCFVVGVVFIAQYYVPTTESQDLLRHASNTVKILIGFSYLIGLWSLSHLHWSRIRRQQAGWGYSFLVFIGLTIMLVFGLSGELQKGLELIFARPIPIGEFQGYNAEGRGTIYDWFYNYTFEPAQATMFSLLAFFIASAAYRTFRAKTWEAAFLLLAALLVIFGRVPLSGMIHDIFPQIADWIMAYPNLAAKRGILIGVSLGIVGTALRVIFGIERAYIGGD